MKSRWSLIALVAAGIALLTAWPLEAQNSPPHTVQQVDLQRYAGLWYEQARFPMFFQRNCASNTTAQYSLRADGKVDVVNSCERADGSRIQSVGIARIKDKDPAKLEVRFAPDALSFLPFVWADYWIIDLDPDYRWAIVGSPNKKYLWILTRDRRIDWALKEQLIQKARRHGYNTSRIIETRQD